MSIKYKLKIVKDPCRWFRPWSWSIRRNYREYEYTYQSTVPILSGYEKTNGNAFTYASARKKAIKAARILAQKDLNDEEKGETYNAYELFRPEVETAPERNPRKILERLNQIEIEEWSKEFDRIKEKQNV